MPQHSAQFSGADVLQERTRMSPASVDQYLTWRELAEFLTKHGFPISYSTLLKMGMPSRKDGPPAEGYWGNCCLYDPAKALAWAKRRFRTKWRPAA
jgi:hypothetical protein